jgi:polysaccharide export outer membrane protein
MKVKSVLLVLALCSLASVAAAQDSGGAAPQAPSVSSSAPSLDSMGVKKYLLGPGDMLDLRVYNEPQFNGPLVVDDEGNIAIPFIEAPIRAQCRSDREIKIDVVKALSKYLNKPQVSLRLTEAKSRPPAIVYGAVRSPQRVQMQRRVRLLDLLAVSGGVNEAAGGDVQIFHTEPLMCPEPEDLVAVPMDTYKPSDPTDVGYDLFNLRELREGKQEANPVIRPGDIVIVQEAQPVYVMGAVRSPQGLYLKEGMQLKQAVAMVGGLTREAKASEVVIWRKQKGHSERKKMIVNYNDIKKEKLKDIDLQPYDIVEVQDNSGSIAFKLRDMLMGGATGSMGSIFQTLPMRVIY